MKNKFKIEIDSKEYPNAKVKIDVLVETRSRAYSKSIRETARENVNDLKDSLIKALMEEHHISEIKIK